MHSHVLPIPDPFALVSHMTLAKLWRVDALASRYHRLRDAFEQSIGSRGSVRRPRVRASRRGCLLCLNLIPPEPSALSGGGATHGGGLLRPLR